MGSMKQFRGEQSPMDHLSCEGFANDVDLLSEMEEYTRGRLSICESLRIELVARRSCRKVMHEASAFHLLDFTQLRRWPSFHIEV